MLHTTDLSIYPTRRGCELRQIAEPEEVSIRYGKIAELTVQVVSAFGGAPAASERIAGPLKGRYGKKNGGSAQKETKPP